jgi:4-amino-4-deoxy-L-arabinose transferase-like glycosyltransferase
MKFDDRHLSVSRFCIKITLLLLLVGVIFSIIVLSWVPPVSRDALTHHLAVPKLYLQEGGIHEIPSVIFSYYPMNLDLLYLIPLYFGNDIVPKFIHFAFALLTTWLIFSYLRKRLDTIWAGGGALFFLSLPIIVKLSITVYVDLGLVFFSTASLMGLFKWIESRFQLKYLILSAFCCGLALGVKYNGLIVLFLLTVFVPLLYKQQAKVGAAEKKVISLKGSLNRQLRAVGSGTLFCLIALMVFSPWMIRNYIWKDNPVYPLYNSFFNPQKVAMAPGPGTGVKPETKDIISPGNKKKSSSWGPFAIRKVVYGEAWWEIALIPVRIFFQGRDDDPRYFDGKLNPFLFLLPIFAFFQLKMNPEDVKVEKKILFSFAILFILYAYFKTDMRIRYIAPAIPPLVILSTFGFYQIHQFIARQWSQGRGQLSQIPVVMIAAVILSFNAVYVIHQFKLVDPFSYISGRVERDAYITRYRPEHTIFQYANGHLAADAKLLALFMGNRRYYSDRELIFGNSLFLKLVKKVDSDEAILNDLQRRGFSHLLIRYDLFNNWTDKQFSDREKEMLKVFFVRDARHLLSKSGYGLFELVDNQ